MASDRLPTLEPSPRARFILWRPSMNGVWSYPRPSPRTRWRRSDPNPNQVEAAARAACATHGCEAVRVGGAGPRAAEQETQRAPRAQVAPRRFVVLA